MPQGCLCADAPTSTRLRPSNDLGARAARRMFGVRSACLLLSFQRPQSPFCRGLRASWHVTTHIVKPRNFEYSHLMSQNVEAPTVAEVVGRNVRKLRGGHTADVLARAARREGLKWGSGRVSELEAGKVSPTLPTLFVLAQALHVVTGQSVSLADLVRADGLIRINDKLEVKAGKLVESVSESPVDLTLGDLPGDPHKRALTAAQGAVDSMRGLPEYLLHTKASESSHVDARFGETEERIAKSLGISRTRMNLESAYLWRDAFSTERDRRAGPDANPQKRGRVSRELKDELRASVRHGEELDEYRELVDQASPLGQQAKARQVRAEAASEKSKQRGTDA